MYTMNNELNPATVFSFGVDLQVLKCHVIEAQPMLFTCKTLTNFIPFKVAPYSLEKCWK